MPHMANLPWNLSYFFIFISLFLMLLKIFFSYSSMSKSDSPSLLDSEFSEKNNWKW